jgi:hypothetical protein
MAFLTMMGESPQGAWTACKGGHPMFSTADCAQGRFFNGLTPWQRDLAVRVT